MEKQFDFVAIGDIATDAFIRIKDAHLNCNLKDDTCEICLRFGDKVPYESVEVIHAVGNSPNAAVSAARLGLSVALIADLGDDQIAIDSLESLRKDNVDTSHITLHKGMKSNYHYVLWYDVDRTILVKHEVYPYRFPNISPAPRWMYLSSLGENSVEYHEAIANYLKDNPEVRLSFQPGTFQMKLGTKKLKTIYERTNIFFCNAEEAKRILNKEGEIGELLKGIAFLGPRMVCITDGPKGAYAYDGHNMWFMPPFPELEKAIQRTGAGDAFASTITAALALGKPFEEALKWGPINSGSVIQHVGAQKGLLPRARLEEYLANAPENYKLKKLM